MLSHRQTRFRSTKNANALWTETLGTWTLTSLRQDSEEDVGEVQLPLSDPGTQVLPVQQVQEETKLTQQLLHRCSRHRNGHDLLYEQETSKGHKQGIGHEGGSSSPPGLKGSTLSKTLPIWRSALVTPPGDPI